MYEHKKSLYLKLLTILSSIGSGTATDREGAFLSGFEIGLSLGINKKSEAEKMLNFIRYFTISDLNIPEDMYDTTSKEATDNLASQINLVESMSVTFNSKLN